MKKRILLVSKFYYRRGGDCNYTLNLETLLRQKGHEVAVFAMHHPENLPSDYDKYFADEINFSQGSKLKAAARTLGFGDVRERFSAILRDFRPDVVHLNNVHSYLSPVVGELAAKAGAKVVWTLHDYKLVCPAYTCLRDNTPCEICFDNKFNVLTHKCMKGSAAASALGLLEAEAWSRSRLERFTSTFICPSAFMLTKMKQGRFDEHKLCHLPNFIAPEILNRYAAGISQAKRADYYCYVGRLSSEKGVETLCKAAAQLPYKLKIAGDGPLAQSLKEQFAGNSNIEFLGKLTPTQVSDLLSNAQFSVIPSECYENNPLSAIESFCGGTPVVGADIAGIPELINPSNGLTFSWGNAEALREAISEAYSRDWNYEKIAADALALFSPERHYERLMEVY